MNAKAFEVMMEKRLRACASTLRKKCDEYSSDVDRLHNFKVAGAARGVSPETALDGMLMKHLVSLWDMIDKLEEFPDTVIPDGWVDEKLGDIINYMILLEGLISDRMDERPVTSD